MRTVPVALLVLCLRAQTPLMPDLHALSKIHTRMIYNLRHQPNYTCVETTERCPGHFVSTVPTPTRFLTVAAQYAN
jgi:hypothetical protein